MQVVCKKCICGLFSVSSRTFARRIDDVVAGKAVFTHAHTGQKRQRKLATLTTLQRLAEERGQYNPHKQSVQLQGTRRGLWLEVVNDYEITL